MVSSGLTGADVQHQLGAAYMRYDEPTRARHLEMLDRITELQHVDLDVQPRDDGRWLVTVCVADWLGALSVIAGLLTAYRLDIAGADVFTVHPPKQNAPPRPPVRPRRRRRSTLRRQPESKILDVFEVIPLDPPTANLWDRLRAELGELVSLLAAGESDLARERTIDRVSEAARSASAEGSHLLPVSIDVTNDSESPFTRLTIVSPDTLGFVFALSSALVVFDVNVERAEVRTVNGQAHDTFWLTDRRGRRIVSQDRLNELKVAVAVVKQFTHLLPSSPSPAQALRQFGALVRQILSSREWSDELKGIRSASVLRTLADLMGVSQFLWDDFLRLQHENLFPVLVDTVALEKPRPKQRLRTVLDRRLRSADSQGDRVEELNSFKDREMFRVDLRHITGRIGFRDFAEELSDLAEVAVAAAADVSYEALRSRHGVPSLTGGRSCGWAVCALGKFGGREMGYGSDVELIFLYEGDGRTVNGAAVGNSAFFGDLVRTVQHSLTTHRDGIFELDTRLRPYGTAGPPASSLEGFRRYYSEEGDARQFERMALVKLRPVAGDPELARRVIEHRDAFVYSGLPLDVADIRSLRRRQAAELVPDGETSAKHSPGGLVDVEYFVQACQITYGHRDTSVRVTNTLDAIGRLSRARRLTNEQAAELEETYGFLRRLIDALRVVRGHAKDLTLPGPDSREFVYLANRLGYDSTAELRIAVEERMTFAAGVWHDGLSAVP